MGVDFSFAWPLVLLALPLPWLILRFLPPAVPAVMLKLPALATYKTLRRGPTRGGMSGLAWLAWGLLVLAAARPQWPEPAPLPLSGRSLMLAFDLSASMATRDMAHRGQTVARIDAALELAQAFLARRDGDRVGLIVFGKQAYVHVPPTLDLQAVRAALAGVQVGLAGNETALGDALALGTRQLREQPENARVLVLLTDGAQTAGTLSPQRAAWLAQREGVRIHAVGLGGAAMKQAAFDLDEPTLQAVTGQTGGHYARATDSNALAAFFTELDTREPLPDQDDARRAARELYPWPLLAALFLMVWLLRSRGRPAEVDFLHQAVDAHLLPHVLAKRPSAGRGMFVFWLLAALLLILPWLMSVGDSYRATPLRVLLADLSAAENDALIRSRLAFVLDALPPGETALIVFAGDAFLAVPPTRDPRNIAVLLPELAAGIMPVAGRRPARAEALAQELLQRHPGRPSRVITIDAVTSLEMMLADAQSLQGWHRLGATVDHAPILLWLLLPLLPLALLSLRRGGVLASCAVLPASTFWLVAMCVPTDAEAAGNDGVWQAVAHYRMERYDETVRLLSGKGDAISHYNRGNALARLGRFAEAESAYSAVLEQQPDHADAAFNRELMRKLQAQPPEPPPAGKGKPPPPAEAPAAQNEANRIAEQWLRGVPDDPGGLLRAKLRLEHERRQREGR